MKTYLCARKYSSTCILSIKCLTFNLTITLYFYMLVCIHKKFLENNLKAQVNSHEPLEYNKGNFNKRKFTWLANMLVFGLFMRKSFRDRLSFNKQHVPLVAKILNLFFSSRELFWLLFVRCTLVYLSVWQANFYIFDLFSRNTL